MTIRKDNRERICIDRVIPLELDEEARAIALDENPANAPEPAPPTASRGERLALVKRKMWRPGRVLRVRFLDGPAFLHEKVQKYANEWTRYANLDFDFGNDRDAEIRISFSFDKGSSWSAVGADARVERYFPRHEPTMNFGWFDESTEEAEISRVTLHEFGHAIGCIHEHQNPDGGIQWDEEAVLRRYSGPPNFWDEETIRFNILEKYKKNRLMGSKFDPDSIMLYSFPASMTTNGVGTRENDKLSETDIAFIKKAYPGRA